MLWKLLINYITTKRQYNLFFSLLIIMCIVIIEESNLQKKNTNFLTNIGIKGNIFIRDSQNQYNVYGI